MLPLLSRASISVRKARLPVMLTNKAGVISNGTSCDAVPPSGFASYNRGQGARDRSDQGDGGPTPGKLGVRVLHSARAT